jgi:ribA/ribD-fused uncharacterized protein
LSNWYMEDFYSYGIKYNCAEQYIMSAKAKLFNDEETYEKIMQSNSPYQQKKLGRAVKNFNQSTWDHFINPIAFMACYSKFQFSHLKNDLVDILKKQKIPVEASPKDNLWGIGYDAKNAIKNRNNWGKNLLGLNLNAVGNLFLNH